MSEPYFNTPERKRLLLTVAESWIGTPFIANGEVKGGGVSCQKLTGNILRECGHLPADFQIPAGVMNRGSAHKTSIMIPIFASLPQHFQDVTGEKPQPGDVLGILCGACMHHLGTVVDSRRFIHVFDKQRYGVMYSALADPTYSSRIDRVWRTVQ